MIKRERLMEIVSYDTETGDFTYRINKGIRKAGMKAGSLMTDGYWRLRLDGHEYRAHRLAWLYAYGVWPEMNIDHMNLNKLDNRLANLRLATVSQNTANQSLSKKSTSGFKGVTLHAGGKWQASIKSMCKFYYLGLFENPEDAHAAYIAAAKELFGKFARTA
jgi:hypothetical protein